MNTGIKPATGKWSPKPSLNKSQPGPDQVLHNSSLHAPPASLGEATCCRPERRVGSCWCAENARPWLLSTQVSQMRHCVSLRQRAALLITCYKKSSVFPSSVFLGWTQTHLAWSTSRPINVLPPWVSGNKGTWHKHNAPAAACAESDPGLSCLLHPCHRNRLICELVSRVKSRTLTSSSSDSSHPGSSFLRHTVGTCLPGSFMWNAPSQGLHLADSDCLQALDLSVPSPQRALLSPPQARVIHSLPSRIVFSS